MLGDKGFGSYGLKREVDLAPERRGLKTLGAQGLSATGRGDAFPIRKAAVLKNVSIECEMEKESQHEFH